MSGPLDGIRVIDFSRLIAGPQCSQTLGDFGADIVKVEHPNGGDDGRGFGPPDFAGEAAFFVAYNRNKRSIAIDLATPEGLAVARDLIRDADVLVENFSTGVMERFGLGHEALLAEHPRLVYCSVSAYGREGPYASRAGYDPVVQAESGFMAMTGYPGGEPLRSGIPVIDMGTGMVAVQGVLAALFERETSGRGQHVEVALFDTAVSLTHHFAMIERMTGENPRRLGNESPSAVPLGVFHGSDGPFQVTVAGERVWRKFCLDVIERPDLYEDPRFHTSPARVGNRTALNGILADIFRERPREEWARRLREANVPAGAIRTVAEAVESAEVRERALVQQAPHTAAGTVPVLRSPIRFAGTPGPDPVGAPLLGEHTDAILAELGYDAGRIAELRRIRAVA